MTWARRHRWKLVAGTTAAVLAVAGVGVLVYVTSQPEPAQECRATVPDLTYRFDFAQAASATTIAAVGAQLGVPHHAVTVALATALQESKLRNLPSGDRDSLGLFQQRPSQGWGTPEQILDPVYSATAFYNALMKVKDWDTMAVNDAAQRVQRSGTPQAYAKWEDQARFMAGVLTGETPAGFVCRFSRPASVATQASILEALARDFGQATLGASDQARGWSEASWLVGHAHDYGIASVEFDGFQWKSSTGQWKPRQVVQPTVVFTGSSQ